MNENQLGLYSNRPFPHSDLREESASGLTGGLSRFLARELGERDIVYGSAGQAIALLQCHVAHILWGRCDDDRSKTARNEIVDAARTIFDTSRNEGWERRETIESALKKVTFPPSRNHPEGNAAYWDTVAPGLVRDVIRTSFLSNPEIARGLAATGDMSIDLDTDSRSVHDAVDELRNELTRREMLMRQSLERGEPVYGDDDVHVAFAMSRDFGYDLHSLCDAAVAVVEGEQDTLMGVDGFINVGFDPWNYPKKDGEMIVGTDWRGMAASKASDILNILLDGGISTRRFTLGFYSQVSEASSEETGRFAGYLLRSLVSEELEYSERFGRRRVTRDESLSLDLVRVITAGDSGMDESMARHCQRLGIDVTVMMADDFHEGIWRYRNADGKFVEGEPAFKMRFPSLPVAGRYMERRRKQLETVGKPAEEPLSPLLSFRESRGGYYDSLMEMSADCDILLLLVKDSRSMIRRRVAQLESSRCITLCLDRSAEHLASRLASLMDEQGFPTRGLRMVVAGDRMQSFPRRSQSDLNDIVVNLFWTLEQDHSMTFRSIASCGTGGVEQAAAVTAVSLGIRAEILAPHGWRSMDEKGNTVLGKDSFVSRFRGYDVLDEAAAFNTTLTDEDFIERSPIDISKPYHREFFDSFRRRPFSLKDLIIMTEGPEAGMYKSLGKTVGQTIPVGKEGYLGLQDAVFANAEHALSCLMAYIGFIHAEEAMDRTACLKYLDLFLKKGADISEDELTHLTTALTSFLGDKADERFESIFENVAVDAIAVSMICNPRNLVELVSTEGRSIVCTERPEIGMIYERAREHVKAMLARESHRQSPIGVSSSKPLQSPENKGNRDEICITEDDDSFPLIEKAWRRGQVVSTGLTADSNGAYLAVDKNEDGTWDYQPNRFYLTWDEQQGRYVIESARFVHESGFGEYVNVENLEVRNGDRVIVTSQDNLGIMELMSNKNGTERRALSLD